MPDRILHGDAADRSDVCIITFTPQAPGLLAPRSIVRSAM